MNSDFDQRVQAVKDRARGYWTSILRDLGVSADILSGKNRPCPINGCGGTDRFQYTDKFGEGNWHCRSCGAGGGLKLAHAIRGGRFGDLLAEIERRIGMARLLEAPALPGPSPERMKRLCQKTWAEARSITAGDEVDRYLSSRGLGLEVYPKTLRLHPQLGYFEKKPGQKRAALVATYPAMLACVQGSDDHAVTLHRTYLKDGRKALGSQSKKLLSSGINGSAVRLAPATTELAIAEGIETALAVQRRTGKPTWAALSCGNMEKIWIPEHIERAWIYADNDADGEFAGQTSAYILAQRLVREARKAGRRRSVEVYVPRHAGTDWADVCRATLAKERLAA